MGKKTYPEAYPAGKETATREECMGQDLVSMETKENLKEVLGWWKRRMRKKERSKMRRCWNVLLEKDDHERRKHA